MKKFLILLVFVFGTAFLVPKTISAEYPSGCASCTGPNSWCAHDGAGGYTCVDDGYAAQYCLDRVTDSVHCPSGCNCGRYRWSYPGQQCFNDCIKVESCVGQPTPTSPPPPPPGGCGASCGGGCQSGLSCSVGGVCWGSSCESVPQGCPYESTQAQVRQNPQIPWSDSANITLGQEVLLAGFHNATGQFASPQNVDFFMVGPGVNQQLNPPYAISFIPPSAGTYTFEGRTRNPSGGYYTEAACNDSGTIVVTNPATPTPTTTTTPSPTSSPTPSVTPTGTIMPSNTPISTPTRTPTPTPFCVISSIAVTPPTISLGGTATLSFTFAQGYASGAYPSINVSNIRVISAGTLVNQYGQVWISTLTGIGQGSATITVNGNNTSGALCTAAVSVSVSQNSPTPTPLGNPSPTPYPNQCNTLTIKRNGQIISAAQINLGDTIVVTGYANGSNVSAIRFLITKDGIAQTPIDVPAISLATNSWFAELTLQIETARYSISVEPVVP